MKLITQDILRIKVSLYPDSIISLDRNIVNSILRPGRYDLFNSMCFGTSEKKDQLYRAGNSSHEINSIQQQVLRYHDVWVVGWYIRHHARRIK